MSENIDNSTDMMHVCGMIFKWRNSLGGKHVVCQCRASTPNNVNLTLHFKGGAACE